MSKDIGKKQPTYKGKCEHGFLEATNEKLVEFAYENYAIIEVDLICEECNETIGTEKKHYFYKGG